MDDFMKKSKCDVSDAVHPRFASKKEPEEVNKYQVENDYFCIQCKEFFYPSVEGLKIHFDGAIVEHKPFGDCFYCSGKVYEYRFRNNREFFHDCPNPH